RCSDKFWKSNVMDFDRETVRRSAESSDASGRSEQPIEVSAEDLRLDLGRRTDRVERRHLLVVDVLHPSPRKERRVAAEEQTVRPDDRERLPEDRRECQARVKFDPAV